MSGPGEALHKDAMALQAAGNLPGALAAYDAALAADPGAAPLHYGRAGVLFALGRVDEAIAGYDACLRLAPDIAAAHYNRATVLTRLQRLPEALAGLDRALALAPGMANGWNNRSGVLQAMGRHEEALESIERVLKLRPRDDGAYYNAGIMFLALQRYEEAQKVFEQALLLNPRHPDALGCLGAAALRACNWPRLAQLMPQLFAVIRQGKSVVPPLTLLAISDDPALQKLCAEINTRRTLADTALTGDPPPLWTGEAYGHRRIRVGYISTDLRNHPVGTQAVSVLEGHDRARFEVIGLFTGRDDGSQAHQRIVKACDQFHYLSDTGDREAAALIRKLEVDILVDLNGQTLGWRPAIFKYRPAPVTAAYLGYAGTTGADFIDYIIGDPHVTPFESRPFYSERIVQLPRSFWPSDPGLPPLPPITRAEAGLPETGFVFCCFNANHKISVEMFQAWMRLLKAVPGSVLWLREGSPAMNQRLRSEAQFRGVEGTRIVLAPRMDSFARHLARQSLADLFVDAFPYNAHVTASDALWAGLPLVTLQGKSFASRVASSFLANLGLEELITTSLKDYEALALALARDPARLAAIRQRLQHNRATAPLFDMPLFMRGLEAAYEQMRARAERGEKPESFAVDAPGAAPVPTGAQGASPA